MRALPVWILAAALFSACSSTGSRVKIHKETQFSWNPLSVQEDLLMKSFPRYYWDLNVDYVENVALTKAFNPVRATSGWKAFEVALATCDQSVNSLMDSNILNMQDYGPKIAKVNAARDAWRKASVHGITPPNLPRGWTKFQSSGLSFTLHVPTSRLGILLVRASRGQLLGIFELTLWDRGNPHIVRHMLQMPIRNPDSYLNYPWNVLMATDFIQVPDVYVTLDRVDSRGIVETGAGEAMATDEK